MKLFEAIDRQEQDLSDTWSQEDAMELGIAIKLFVDDEGERIPPELLRTLQTAYKQLHMYSQFPDEEDGTENW